MKSHYMVEQFFHPRFRTALGAVLVALRVATAYAWTQGALCLHAQMPDALVRIKVQAIPFLEAFATAWSFSLWHGVIMVAGVAFAVGFFTRTSVSIFLLFFIGVGVIDVHALSVCFGSWLGVAMTLLLMALCSRWGYVGGIDELVRRSGIGDRKKRRKMSIG